MAVVVAFFVVTPIAVVLAAHGFQQAAVKEAVSGKCCREPDNGTTDAASGTKCGGGSRRQQCSFHPRAVR